MDYYCHDCQLMVASENYCGLNEVCLPCLRKASEHTLTITGFKSRLEMQTFIDWYGGQGEQDLAIWLDARRCDGEDVREYLNCTSGITTSETQGYMKIGNPADD